MRSRVVCVLFGLVMGWTIAGAPVKGGQKPAPTAPPYTIHRVVALQEGTSSSCPTVPGWSGKPLPNLVKERVAREKKSYQRDGDEPVNPAVSIQAERARNKRSASLDELLFHKSGLDRFCVYTAPTSAPDFPNPKSVGLKRADPDRMALTPTAPVELGAIGEQTWPALADRFLDQVGKVRLAPAASPSVRLVFVDTHRTHEGPPAPPAHSTTNRASWHGHAMANLGNEMVCGHDVAWKSCAVQVATRLALRYDEYTPDMSFSPDPESDGGGHLGLVSDLGVAILAELEYWKENYPDTKLVLNLSVGWDGEYKDLDVKKVADLETSSQTVYKALRIAAHLGALVIASAGNRTGGEDSTSALLPAAWELRPPSWLPFPLYKVVYAVGGVDWQGLPLPNSREGGRPWRVAYGDHAVARTGVPGDGTESTKMYTGTSVSTAVVSSVAAVAWHLRPDLNAAQVMKLIGYTGEALHARADFYAWKPIPWPKPHMRRLSLCQTVLRVCGPDQRLCSPKLETLDCRLAKHSPADLIDIVPKAPTFAGFTRMTPVPSCDSTTRVFLRLSGSLSEPNVCPMETLPDMTAPYRVATQPPENPCPACTAVPDPPRIAAMSSAPGLLSGDPDIQSYGIAVGLDPDWLAQAHQAGTTLKSAILVVSCSTEPAMKERFDITSKVTSLYDSPIPGADSVRLSFGRIGTRRSLAGCTASIDFTLVLHTGRNETEERSVQSPVYVDP